MERVVLVPFWTNSDLGINLNKHRNVQKHMLFDWAAGQGEPCKPLNNVTLGKRNVDNIVKGFIEITQTGYTAVWL